MLFDLGPHVFPLSEHVYLEPSPLFVKEENGAKIKFKIEFITILEKIITSIIIEVCMG